MGLAGVGEQKEMVAGLEQADCVEARQETAGNVGRGMMAHAWGQARGQELRVLLWDL